MRNRTITIDGQGTIFKVRLDTCHIQKQLKKHLSVYYDEREKCLKVYAFGQPVIRLEVEE
jgi:hypothetical protein